MIYIESQNCFWFFNSKLYGFFFLLSSTVNKSIVSNTGFSCFSFFFYFSFVLYGFGFQFADRSGRCGILQLDRWDRKCHYYGCCFSCLDSSNEPPPTKSTTRPQQNCVAQRRNRVRISASDMEPAQTRERERERNHTTYNLVFTFY